MATQPYLQTINLSLTTTTQDVVLEDQVENDWLFDVTIQLYSASAMTIVHEQRVVSGTLTVAPSTTVAHIAGETASVYIGGIIDAPNSALLKNTLTVSVASGTADAVLVIRGTRESLLEAPNYIDTDFP